MTKIIAYDDDTREFVSNVDPIFGSAFTRNTYQARQFVNVSEAERWLSENLPPGSYTLLEVIEV